MNKKLFFGIILVIVSSVTRFLYASYQPQPLLNADSYGYYGIAGEIIERPVLSSFVNQYRTPVYPTVLALFTVVNGKYNVSLDAISFRPVLNQLVFFQSAVAIISIVLVYYLLLQLSISAFCAFAISTFLSLNVYVYPLEHAVMTDSLANSLLIVLTFLVILLVKKPSRKTYIIFALLSAVSWLLRPNLLLIPFVTLPFFWFFRSYKRYLWTNISVLMFSLLLPVVFVYLNSVYHGYRGISQASEIALLGRILEFRLPLEAGSQYETYYGSIHKYWSSHKGYSSPFQFIDTYTPRTYVDTGLMTELQSFDRVVITANLPEYIFKSISYIPNIFSDNAPLLGLNENASSGPEGFFSLLWHVNKIIWHTGYLIFFLWPVSMLIYFRKPTSDRLIPVLLGSIGVSQLLLIVLFDYYERGLYARLSSAVQIQVYLFLIVIVRQNILRKRK